MTDRNESDMTAKELETEFVKAGKMCIHKIDGSQQKAIMRYLSTIGGRNSEKSVEGVMRIIYSSYKKSQDVNKGLALYLNTQMSNEL